MRSSKSHGEGVMNCDNNDDFNAARNAEDRTMSFKAEKCAGEDFLRKN